MHEEQLVLRCPAGHVTHLAPVEVMVPLSCKLFKAS